MRWIALLLLSAVLLLAVACDNEQQEFTEAELAYLSAVATSQAQATAERAYIEALATSQARATATPTHRGDCDAIRGTDYLSPPERTWFLDNCLTPTATLIPAAAPTGCGAPQNPWGYDFCPGGKRIYSPPSDFCSYFPCIGNFWNGRGHVIQCRDGMFGKSGGIQGSCSYHGGNSRALLSY